MNRRAAFAIAILALSPLAAPPGDASTAQTTGVGFDVGEEAHLRAASAGEPRAIRALADFYAAHDLWPETLAALARLSAPDASARLLAVEAEFRLERNRRVVALTAGEPTATAFRALSLTRLGAYAEAAAAFEKAQPPAGLAAAFHLAAAEARVFSGDAANALVSLDAAATIGVAPADAARFRFLRARVRLALGNDRSASADLRRAASAPPDDWSMRARVALAGTVEALEDLRLQWSSEAFDRDRLMAEASMRLSQADYERAFAAFARVARRYPLSDAALAAQAKIGASLGALFDHANLPIGDVARIFFDHAEFAPPGREGDGLIRKAAERLSALGLHREAAMLLDHQVFKRLRGADRARVAADLADLHLAAQAPDAALRALRSTRLAGLDADLNARRQRLEALALAKSGKRDGALALLEKAQSPETLALRASINWDDERWGEAARDYAAVFAASQSATTTSRFAAVRAATAYMLAGDRVAYRAFVIEAAPRLEGTAEEKLIRSLGDVDRDAFLSQFMDDYRALYASAPAKG